MVLAVLALSSCGDSTGPSSRTLSVGRYRYEAYGGEYSGTLTLTYATADSVAGTWDVRDRQGRSMYQSAIGLGFYNVDAYVLYAKGAVATSLTYAHRIARNGDAITCSANIVLASTVPCVVAYLGR
jgi:hypothetical protein